MKANTAVIDYGMGNLASVCRAIEKCGASAFCTSDPDKISTASHIILPGVGGFREGIHELKNRGLVEPLRNQARAGKPLLGVCLGMQLLADIGSEGGETEGLGLVSGKVVRLEPKEESERVPHIGWNEVCFSRASVLTEEIPEASDFYFVHSYHFVLSDKQCEIGKTNYCGEFSSVVAHDNVFGAQFHPEKSSRAGIRLIKNFLKIG